MLNIVGMTRLADTDDDISYMIQKNGACFRVKTPLEYKQFGNIFRLDAGEYFVVKNYNSYPDTSSYVMEISYLNKAKELKTLILDKDRVEYATLRASIEQNEQCIQLSEKLLKKQNSLIDRAEVAFEQLDSKLNGIGVLVTILCTLVIVIFSSIKFGFLTDKTLALGFASLFFIPIIMLIMLGVWCDFRSHGYKKFPKTMLNKYDLYDIWYDRKQKEHGLGHWKEQYLCNEYLREELSSLNSMNTQSLPNKEQDTSLTGGTWVKHSMSNLQLFKTVK